MDIQFIIVFKKMVKLGIQTSFLIRFALSIATSSMALLIESITSLFPSTVCCSLCGPCCGPANTINNMLNILILLSIVWENIRRAQPGQTKNDEDRE